MVIIQRSLNVGREQHLKGSSLRDLQRQTPQCRRQHGSLRVNVMERFEIDKHATYVVNALLIECPESRYESLPSFEEWPERLRAILEREHASRLRL